MSGFTRRLLAAPLLAAIRGYQLCLSPFLPMSCRFAPSCSQYAAEAVARHGALRGGWLALRRLARCHPWGGAGFDPVPPALNDGHTQPDHAMPAFRRIR